MRMSGRLTLRLDLSGKQRAKTGTQTKENYLRTEIVTFLLNDLSEIIFLGTKCPGIKVQLSFVMRTKANKTKEKGKVVSNSICCLAIL